MDAPFPIHEIDDFLLDLIVQRLVRPLPRFSDRASTSLLHQAREDQGTMAESEFASYSFGARLRPLLGLSPTFSARLLTLPTSSCLFRAQLNSQGAFHKAPATANAQVRFLQRTGRLPPTWQCPLGAVEVQTGVDHAYALMYEPFDAARPCLSFDGLSGVITAESLSAEGLMKVDALLNDPAVVSGDAMVRCHLNPYDSFLSVVPGGALGDQVRRAHLSSYLSLSSASELYPRVLQAVTAPQALTLEMFLLYSQGDPFLPDRFVQRCMTHLETVRELTLDLAGESDNSVVTRCVATLAHSAASFVGRLTHFELRCSSLTFEHTPLEGDGQGPAAPPLPRGTPEPSTLRNFSSLRSLTLSVRVSSRSAPDALAVHLFRHTPLLEHLDLKVVWTEDGPDSTAAMMTSLLDSMAHYVLPLDLSSCPCLRRVSVEVTAEFLQRSARGVGSLSVPLLSSLAPSAIASLTEFRLTGLMCPSDLEPFASSSLGPGSLFPSLRWLELGFTKWNGEELDLTSVPALRVLTLSFPGPKDLSHLDLPKALRLPPSLRRLKCELPMAYLGHRSEYIDLISGFPTSLHHLSLEVRTTCFDSRHVPGCSKCIGEFWGPALSRLTELRTLAFKGMMYMADTGPLGEVLGSLPQLHTVNLEKAWVNEGYGSHNISEWPREKIDQFVSALRGQVRGGREKIEQQRVRAQPALDPPAAHASRESPSPRGQSEPSPPLELRLYDYDALIGKDDGPLVVREEASRNLWWSRRQLPKVGSTILLYG